MPEARYRAFISYSHRDDKWAAWLHRALEAYRPPKYLVGQQTPHGSIPPRLTPIFRDRDELPSATDLSAIINAALERSSCQIVICSPAAARSKWVNEEILTFKRLGRADRIFSLIVAGEPYASGVPGSEDQECFPPALRFKLDENGELGSEPAEPIAADAREGKDGKLNAKIKLIAGMLGVGFDALRQRELHRAHRRLVLIASAAFGGMLITSGLAGLALMARTEAIKQRTRAQAETETSRQVTNFLVDLFKVSDPSEALGNTITAREILDRGARRIEFNLDKQPEIRATLLDTVGTVYRSLGLYEQANDLLGRGLETRRKLFGERHPQVARSEASVGQVMGLQAKYVEAADLYENSIKTLRETPDADPAQLAASLYGLAEIRSFQGDNKTAEQLLRDAIAIQRSNGNGESLELARSIGQLGATLAGQARYKESEPLLQQSLDMYRRVVPGGVHPELNDALNNLAYFFYDTGRYEEAEKLYRESLQLNMRLLGDKHPGVAGSLNNLAMALQDSGNLAEARTYLHRALDLRLAALGDKHPLIAQSYNNLAFLYHDLGKMQEALDYSRKALAIYRIAHPGDHADVAYGLQNLAGWLVEQGDYAAAEPLLKEALAINDRILPKDHPDYAITQTAMALYLLRTGNVAAALDTATAAHETFMKAYGPDHWRTAWAGALEGASLAALKRYAEAEPLLVQSYGLLHKGAQANGVQTKATLGYLEDLYVAWGRRDDAARYRAMRTVAKAE